MRSYRTGGAKYINNNNGNEFSPGCLTFIVGFIILIFLSSRSELVYVIFFPLILLLAAISYYVNNFIDSYKKDKAVTEMNYYENIFKISDKCQKLNKLNKKLKCYYFPKIGGKDFVYDGNQAFYYINVTVSGRRQLNSFNFDNEIYKLISTYDLNCEEYIRELSENIKIEKDYLKKCKGILKKESYYVSGYDPDDYSQDDYVPSDYFIDNEETVFNDNIIYIPTDIIFVVTVKCPQNTLERNQFDNNIEERYSIFDLSRMQDDVNARKVREMIKKQERSLLTNKLRYAVLKRDGFKCTICGRTEEDGVKLHVDHIKPIAKGGKTTLKNLRTLCDECNLGKSDSYDEEGIN